MFPLCWMMAPVTLLSNLLNLYPLTLRVHPHVEQFVGEWGAGVLIDVDETEPSCPLVRPPQVMRYFVKNKYLRGLDKVRVAIFKTKQLYDRAEKQQCMAMATNTVDTALAWVDDAWVDTLNDYQYIKQLKHADSSVRHFLKHGLGDYLSPKGKSDVATDNFDKHLMNAQDVYSFTAAYTDRVVQRVLDGNPYFADHFLCVQKFSGSSEDLMYALLAYDGTLKPNASLCQCIKVANQADGPAALQENGPLFYMLTDVQVQKKRHVQKLFEPLFLHSLYKDTNYCPIGGVIESGSNDRFSHLSSFVLCDGGHVRFLDTADGSKKNRLGSAFRGVDDLVVYLVLYKRSGFALDGSDTEVESEVESDTSTQLERSSKRRRVNLQTKLMQLFTHSNTMGNSSPHQFV